jgi:hypothetical protein
MAKFIIRLITKIRLYGALAFVFLGIISAEAQRDAIITQADEEIRCRILEETPTQFVYAYVGRNGKILKNEIFKNLVKDFRYNKYDADLAIIEDRKNGKSKSRKVSAPASPAVVVNQSTNKRKSDLPSDGQVKTNPSPALKEAKVEENGLNSKTGTPKQIAGQPEAETKKKSERSTEKSDAILNSGTPKSERAPDHNEDQPSNHGIETPLHESEKNAVINGAENDKKVVSAPVTSEFKNYLKWRAGLKGGIGNIRDNNFVANNNFGLYQEKLMKGWTFGADLAFFPIESFGLGLVYTDFKSSNSANGINYINQMTGAEASGNISNKISRKFIGPALFLRKSIDYKTFVVMSGGPGMYLYSDKGDYNSAMFDYRGKQWGAAATLGLDFLLGNDIIGRDIILSLEAGYNYGRLNELDFGDGSGPTLLNSPVIMDRLDFSIGLRFVRFPRYLKSLEN